MNLHRDVPWKAAAAAIALIVVVTVIVVWRQDAGSQPLEVHYPYWCAECKAVFDVSELKEDYPKNWRIAPGGPNDSVVICIKCNKGWAYPVSTCDHCGTKYVRYLFKGARCPKCHPDAAKAAKRKGVDLSPPEINE